MPQTRTRVVGSGFTTFNYRGQPIAFLDAIADSGQTPVGVGAGGGQGWEPVHPLGSRHPVEIATSRAVNAGTISMTIRELWNEPVWWQLSGLRGSYDIVAVWESLARDPSAVTAQMLIKPPGSNTWRGKTYHNVTLTFITDDENVTVGSMTQARTITAVYTHTTPIATPAAA